MTNATEFSFEKYDRTTWNGYDARWFDEQEFIEQANLLWDSLPTEAEVERSLLSYNQLVTESILLAKRAQRFTNRTEQLELEEDYAKLSREWCMRIYDKSLNSEQQQYHPDSVDDYFSIFFEAVTIQTGLSADVFLKNFDYSRAEADALRLPLYFEFFRDCREVFNSSIATYDWINWPYRQAFIDGNQLQAPEHLHKAYAQIACHVDVAKQHCFEWLDFLLLTDRRLITYLDAALEKLNECSEILSKYFSEFEFNLPRISKSELDKKNLFASTFVDQKNLKAVRVTMLKDQLGGTTKTHLAGLRSIEAKLWTLSDKPNSPWMTTKADAERYRQHVLSVPSRSK